jgi:uncharacterized protein Smg (DUF494 family)
MLIYFLKKKVRFLNFPKKNMEIAKKKINLRIYRKELSKNLFKENWVFIYFFKNSKKKDIKKKIKLNI